MTERYVECTHKGIHGIVFRIIDESDDISSVDAALARMMHRKLQTQKQDFIYQLWGPLS